MGPWQTGTEGARSLAERVRSLVGGSGEVRKDRGLDGTGGGQLGESGKKMCEKC